MGIKIVFVIKINRANNAKSIGYNALIVGVCAASAVALTAALVYGQFWLAAKIMGFTVKKVAKKAGAAVVVGCITATLGISGGAVWAAMNFLL